MKSVPNVEYDEDAQAWLVVKEEGEDEVREGNWMFLLVDLMFVALVDKCSKVMLNCAISFHSLLFTSTVISVLYVTRLMLDDYCNRFYANDIFHRLIYFAYFLCMFVMVMNITVQQTNGRHDDELCAANIYGVGFGFAFIATRIMMVILLVLVIASDKTHNAAQQLTGQVVRSLISAFIAMVLVGADDEIDIFPSRDKYIIYMTIVAIEVSYSAYHHLSMGFAGIVRDIECLKSCGSYLVAAEVYPLDVELFQDRVGAFIMVILGQAIMVLLTPYFDEHQAIHAYPYTLLSIIVVFLYGLIYYEATKGSTSGHTAMSNSLLSAFLYTWLHMILAIAMFMTTAAVAILYTNDVPTGETVIITDPAVTDDADPWIHNKIMSAFELLGSSIGFTVLLIAILSILHRGLFHIFSRKLAKERRAFLIKIVLGLVHFFIPQLGWDQDHQGKTAILVHVFFLMLLVATETEISDDKYKKKKRRSSKSGTDQGETENDDEYIDEGTDGEQQANTNTLYDNGGTSTPASKTQMEMVSMSQGEQPYGEQPYSPGNPMHGGAGGEASHIYNNNNNNSLFPQSPQGQGQEQGRPQGQGQGQGNQHMHMPPSVVGRNPLANSGRGGGMDKEKRVNRRARISALTNAANRTANR